MGGEIARTSTQADQQLPEGSSLLFLTLVNQSSTIPLTQRFNIPATLSFGVGGLCLRVSSFFPKSAKNDLRQDDL